MKRQNIKEVLHIVLHRAMALIFPPQCPLCDKVTGSYIEGKMCNSCHAVFDKEFVSLCPSCKHRSDSCRCVPDVMGSSADLSPYTTVYPLIFSGFYTGYDENSAICKLLFKMKRDNTSGARYVFAGMIAQCVSRALVLRDLNPKDFTVTFIPRGESSLAEYGFDHMEAVSKRVAELLGCQYRSLFVRKGGAAQKALSPDERAENAYTSLFINRKRTEMIKGGKIILLDDVVTTGASMRAAVSKLSLAGADTIIPASAMLSRKKKEEDQ